VTRRRAARLRRANNVVNRHNHFKHPRDPWDSGGVATLYAAANIRNNGQRYRHGPGWRAFRAMHKRSRRWRRRSVDATFP
jgi:hypothetical protein